MNLMPNIEQVETIFHDREPIISAFLPEENRFQRLRREAGELLLRYSDPANRPPLFGLLLGVKDIFHVNGFPTHAGSRLPAEVLKGNEAQSVTQLKEAGALILGKTVTTEFAYFAPGPTRNPHNPEHTPGGSSSGSAAAVAAELCHFALGTQTIGSITRPAAFCGVIGFKPSYDRISRHGVVPLSPSLDHVGFFTRDLDLASRIAGMLCEDWGGLPSFSRKPVLGIPEGPYLEHATPEGFSHFQEIKAHLLDQGFTIKEIPAMQEFDRIEERHNLILAAEAAEVHSSWFANFGEKYHAKTAELISKGRLVAKDDLEKALRGPKKLRSELSSLMAEHEIDLWISPSAPGPAPKGLDSTGDPVMNLPWTHSGLPTLNLPTGRSNDMLPMGLQVTGGWFKDEDLFAWAAQIYSALKNHE